MKMKSDWRVSAGMSQSLKLASRTVHPRFDRGNWLASCAAIAVSSARACSMEVPGFSLPITRRR